MFRKRNKKEEPLDQARSDLNPFPNPAVEAPNESRTFPASEEQIGLLLFPDLFENARQRILDSGALTLSEADLAPLLQHAQAMARETRRQIFDPETNRDDLLRQEEFEADQKVRQELDLVVHNLAAYLLEGQETLAQQLTGEAPAPPSYNVQVGGAMFIAISITGALHDQIFIFSDDVTAWACSLAAGLICGWFLTSALLAQSGADSSQTLKSRLGLIAGIVLGIGLFTLRIAALPSLEGFFFAVGLTILEIGAVLMIHYVAEQYRHALLAFKTKDDAWKKAAAHCDLIQAKLAEQQEKLQQVEARIQRHIQYLTERQLRFQYADQLEELAMATVRNGCAAGVAENVGRRRNVKAKKGGER